jgi:hypothetical protein
MKISSWFGYLAGEILSLFGKSAPKPGLGDLKRADFATSTQRLGIRFNEKIRDVFRLRWLKVAPRDQKPCDSVAEQRGQSAHIRTGDGDRSGRSV